MQYQLSDKIEINTAVVYCITNLTNSKVYIGSTNNFGRRIARHYRELRHDYHPNQHLSRSWKLNPDAFVVSILEHVYNMDIILHREQHYIDLYNSCDPEHGYNKRGNFDFKFLSEESLLRQKAGQEKRKKSVYSFDKDTGELLDVFDSITDAANYVNTSTSNISRACLGKFNYIKGRTWCYSKDYDENKSYIANKPDLTRSDETKLKQSINNAKSKKVYAYKNGDFYKEYPSMRACEQEFGISSGKVAYWINKTGEFVIDEFKILKEKIENVQ